MKNVFNASEELFFDILIIALLSFLYFNYISMSEFTLLLGLIFSFIYFGVNFYIGYKYKLKFIDSLIVGIMGSGMGIFLIFFSFYAEFILKMTNFANWIAIPYFIPTMSIVKLFSININYLYAPVLMIINIYCNQPYQDVYTVFCSILCGQYMYRWIRQKDKFTLFCGICWGFVAILLFILYLTKIFL